MNTRSDRHILRVVIAGGGTGGHLFPGIAVAEEFCARDPENSILFVGPGRPFEVSTVSEKGFAHKRITSEGFKGRGIKNQLVAMLKIPIGVMQSVSILRSFKPHLVMGVGGYSAGPLVIGAWLLRIKIVLHEQNILPGITNRMLFRFANRIYVSFPETKFDGASEKMRLTGDPVRKEIVECAKQQHSTGVQASRTENVFSIMILGGSQGAHRINITILEALEHLDNKDEIFIAHQTGVQDEAQVKQKYEEYGMASDVKAFFKDMERQYQKADLIICRAGATTVAEISALGKGVIFIPFPFAADNHQVMNARALVSTGAAEMIEEKDLSAKILAQRINYYARHPEALRQMGARCKMFGRVDAAAVIVDDCYELIS
ncbi:MAG: undecaprenyldiphospho-muramoylpentapeptide beta-N-acetylglucosaminyltransferase [Desulfobacterales bacterium]|nr:undecaprenyldiphospho-muramoylpentapeptide beta-N-acetylglucosaminyltransferase [Desulfobacterales bacterium]